MSPGETRRAAAARQDALPAPPPRPARPGAPSEPQADRHLQLVPRPRRLRANRRRALVGLLIAGATGMSMALVTLHVLMAENQFRLDSLQQQAAAQQGRYERLSLQVQQLEAPDRIVALAEGRLGMVQPGSVTYLPAISASSHSSGQAKKASAGAKGSGPDTSGPADRSTKAAATAAAGSGQSTVTAPAGPVDWPLVKPYLNGNQ